MILSNLYYVTKYDSVKPSHFYGPPESNAKFAEYVINWLDLEIKDCSPRFFHIKPNSGVFELAEDLVIKTDDIKI